MRKTSKSNDEVSVDVTEENVVSAVEPSDSETVKIKEFLQNVLIKMNIDGCEVEANQDGDVIYLNVVGENAAAVIGHRGETLDALQYLCNLLLNTKESTFKRVTLNAENYREKREKILQRLASNLELKVKRTGRAVKLEPMNPYERRIIHTSLQGSKYVTTQSEGQGAARHVVVSPIEQNDILNVPNGPRKTLNFVYRSEKKRRK